MPTEKEIEALVLANYRRVNPSLTPEKDEQKWDTFIARQAAFLRDQLHLPEQVFAGKRVLDIGCGTGEHSAVYASLGALIDGIEFNDTSIGKMIGLFERHGLASQLGSIENIAISDWQPTLPNHDIVTCNGVLHHIGDFRMGLTKICAAVKPGEPVLLSTGAVPGQEQRILMRKLIQRFAESLEDAIDLAQRWFPDHVERVSKYTDRTFEQIVSDNFLVPQNVSTKLEELFTWLHEENLRYYRTWPPTEPNCINPMGHETVNWLQSEYRHALLDRAARFSYARDNDAEYFKKAPEDVSEKETFEAEYAAIQSLLKEGDRDGLDRFLPTCRIFGRGFCGVGGFWFVGIKNQ